jgi:hypothetical protein
MSFLLRRVQLWQWTTSIVLATTVAVTACTIQLAPAYDPALVNGIRAVNSDIMQLYATTGMGVDKATFPDRVDEYNRIIGAVDALALESQSRPVPDSAIRDKVEQALGQWLASNPTPPAGRDEALSLAAAECADARKVKRAPALTMPVPMAQADTRQYVPASAMALKQVSRAMSLLRDTDCAHGLNNGQVAANKGYTQYFVSEALFYENFLQR